MDCGEEPPVPERETDLLFVESIPNLQVLEVDAVLDTDIENIQNIEGKKVENNFTCQGKTHCSQMTSCEEARFYLKNCPNQSTDGDRDGEPCESQWCN